METVSMNSLKVFVEQNKYNKDIEIPSSVLSSVKNLIIKDPFNLFKIKSNLITEDEIKKSEEEINTLIKLKNVAITKEKELKKKLMELSKVNSEQLTLMKKKLNI